MSKLGREILRDERAAAARDRGAEQVLKAALKTYVVFPHEDYGGSENQMIVRADTPQRAVMCLLAMYEESSLMNSIDTGAPFNLLPARHAKECGTNTWAVFELPENAPAGIIDWDQDRRTDWRVE